MAEAGRVDKRSLRYAGRREELLDAVTEYVVEHGVADLSMRPLAKEVGVSHASLLHHFGSKENLLAEVTEAMRREAIPAALTVESGRDPVGLMGQWWNAQMAPDMLPRFRVMLEIYVRAVLYPDRYVRFLEHVVGQWLAFLDAGVRAAGCPDDQASAEATLILGQIRGLALDLLATGDRDRVDAAFERFVADIEGKLTRWSGPRQES